MPLMAVVDCGSNSFQMRILSVEAGCDVKLIFKDKQQVQLRAGLMHDGSLSDDAQARALACFEQFADAIRQHNVEHVKIVGTYTFRAASNLEPFLQKIESLMGVPVTILSGEEEAYYIYRGVCETEDMHVPHLIIDIGGGSTELILADEHKMQAWTSLDIGCVGVMGTFFHEGVLSQEAFNQAITHTQDILAPYVEHFAKSLWERCLGSSGSIQGLFSVLTAPDDSDMIFVHDLDQVIDILVTAGHCNTINIPGLRPDRISVLAGGTAILAGLFRALEIPCLERSKGALREGIQGEFSRKVLGEYKT